jgi:hypothetical protein
LFLCPAHRQVSVTGRRGLMSCRKYFEFNWNASDAIFRGPGYLLHEVSQLAALDSTGSRSKTGRALLIFCIRSTVSIAGTDV